MALLGFRAWGWRVPGFKGFRIGFALSSMPVEAGSDAAGPWRF